MPATRTATTTKLPAVSGSSGRLQVERLPAADAERTYPGRVVAAPEVPYVDYYNQARPHQGINQQCPVPLGSAARDGPIERRDILGGVLHDYYRRTA